MANDTADTPTKTVEELSSELEAAVKNYEKLNTAHDKLKGDFKELKASSIDATSLQQQLEKLTNDKSKLLREKEELQVAFDTFKDAAKLKDTKEALLLALKDTINPNTALKLIDQSSLQFDAEGKVVPDSLTAAVASLKESDPELFRAPGTESPVRTPSIKPAVDKVTNSAYETEVAAAVKKGSQKELEEVYAKYHMS